VSSFFELGRSKERPLSQRQKKTLGSQCVGNLLAYRSMMLNAIQCISHPYRIHIAFAAARLCCWTFFLPSGLAGTKTWCPCRYSFVSTRYDEKSMPEPCVGDDHAVFLPALAGLLLQAVFTQVKCLFSDLWSLCPWLISYWLMMNTKALISRTSCSTQSFEVSCHVISCLVSFGEPRGAAALELIGGSVGSSAEPPVEPKVGAELRLYRAFVELAEGTKKAFAVIICS
jgi:hypothetical protein